MSPYLSAFLFFILAVVPATPAENYENPALGFEPIPGQGETRFLAHAANYDVLITNQQAVLKLGATSIGIRAAGARLGKAAGLDAATKDGGLFAKVRVAGIRPGIDVTYYGSGKDLEYDLDAAPGADTRDLRLVFDGAGGLTLDADGNLLIHTPIGTIVHHKPIATQGTRQVSADYALVPDGSVAIRLGQYDHQQPLKIDPVITYSSFVNSVNAMVVDSSGNVYVASSGNYVTGSTVTKIKADGTQVYSTQLAGAVATAIAVDSSNRAYVAAYFSTTGGVYSVPAVYQLSPAGVLSQTYAANESPTNCAFSCQATAIAVDAANNTYITGAGALYPTTSGAYQSTSGPAFAIKLDSNFNVVYATNLPAVNSAIAVDAAGNAYIAGSTGAGFPVTQGAFMTTLPAGATSAGFVIKLNATGTAALYSTYLGGAGQGRYSQSEGIRAIAADSAGNAYVAGSTSSTGFPTTPGAYLTADPSTSYTGFVSKLNPSGSALLSSTYLGGSGQDVINSLILAANGDVVLAGTTSSSNFPTTPGALEQTFYPEATQEGFIAQFNPSLSSVLYSTLSGVPGGTVNNFGLDAVAGDGQNYIYAAGHTLLPFYPTTTGTTPSANLPSFLTRIDLSSATACGNVSLSANSATVPSAGGSGSFSVTAIAGCPWTLAPTQLTGTSSDFVTLTTGAQVGSGAVNYTVPVNSSSSAVSEVVTVSGSTAPTSANNFTFTQSGASCNAPMFSSNPLDFPFSGGLEDLGITLPSGCAYNIVNNTSWITVSSGASGSGTGTLGLYAAANSGAQRQGTLTINTATLNVTQDANCTLSLLSSSGTIPASGGMGTISFTTSQPTCAWTAVPTVSWIQISNSMSSGQGSGSVQFTALANPTTLPRMGLVSVGNQLYTVTQATAPANVGIFRFGYFWILDADGNRAFDSPPDLAFPYGGVPGDIPITGDWNGNGHTKVGVYRPSNGLFILDTNGNGVFDAGDYVYDLGVGTQPSDLPVVGDWNGDGRTKVGLFRQGFFWILDYNGNGVFEQGIDKAFPFGGVAGDVPVVGDWTGTGTSKVGLVRYGFFWILDANGNDQFDGTGPFQDYAFAYGGTMGDVPVVGDWNGSGTSKVGVFRFGYFWVLDANGNRAFDGTGPGQDLAFPFGGIAGDKPVVGKW